MENATQKSEGVTNMEWKEKEKGEGEKKLTQLVTIHTRRVAACGGRKSISLPAFIEMHFHLQSVELDVCWAVY